MVLVLVVVLVVVLAVVLLVVLVLLVVVVLGVLVLVLVVVVVVVLMLVVLVVLVVLQLQLVLLQLLLLPTGLVLVDVTGSPTLFAVLRKRPNSGTTPRMLADSLVQAVSWHTPGYTQTGSPPSTSDCITSARLKRVCIGSRSSPSCRTSSVGRRWRSWVVSRSCR